MAQRDWAEKDYYKVLDVEESASKDEIKKAYRKLAQRYHPDANKGDSGAEQRFKEISEAHSILSNDDKRKEYDEMRSLLAAGGQRFYGFRPGEGGGGVRVNIGDIGDIFGGGGGSGNGVFDDLFGFGTRSRPHRGQDVETEVMLTFDEAVNGATVSLPTGGKTRIPPGIANGARIKVPGKGEDDPFGGPGDLFVKVRVQPHPVFSLKGNGNLEVTVPVTYPEAALGAQITVPTLDGEVTVKLPPGTPNGKVLRVRGRGAPKRSGGQGDLLVKVQVEVPQNLSKKEREALESFASLHTASPRTDLEDQVRKTRKAS
ncbi:MAG: DnaJ domain-containing protein [Actinobacteria bacterium]|nr:DnaJ domain-containing protein [Actinomycetota bacterium]